MPENSPRPAPRRPADENTRRTGITRRGRLALLAGGIFVLAAGITVPLLLKDDGSERSGSVVLPEGFRDTQVFAAVDEALGLDPGTTRKAVPEARLQLPGAAGDNPEGYLHPATYPVDGSTTPDSMLAYMVDTANRKLAADRVVEGADRNAVTVHDTVTIASIVQAEADTPADMGKVARVVYNRLDRGMRLQMDSTLNYGLKRSTLNVTTEETRADSPYNTYARDGLPPSPIGNPGDDALNAAVDPSAGEWLYFVTVAPGDTRFSDDYEVHSRHVAEFNANQRSASAGS